MPSYEVLLSKAARKQLSTLPLFIHNKIIEDISGLSLSPRPAGCKKLKGFKNAWRIRVGDYRVIYEIEDKVLRILVIAIGHRKDIYD
ncbi:MAG TPA: type II toxin-antitoxin system RelE/ParE family toxin [Chitinophagaceae bacterium]|jgi:mRNA interferase RelE/StbE|nr:type II toxin-antitoxin system RelE/ParE family toxin [Chitinophagaceae bacterium]